MKIKNIVLFVLIFIIIFFCYEIVIRKYRKKRKSKKNNKNKDLTYPLEVKILMNFYHLDIKKINYNILLHIICIVSSIDIALIVLISGLFDRGYIQIIVALLLVLPVIFISYYITALFYKLKIRRNEK